MAEDYATAYNNEIVSKLNTVEEPVKEVQPHNITKHQLFNSDGVKHVFHVDHTAGKVYIEGDRGLLRFSGTNVEQVSAYPPFDANDTTPSNGYVKHVSDAGIVTYTDLAGQPYAPQDADIEYVMNADGVYVKAVQPATEPEKKSKKQDKQDKQD